MEEMSVVGWAAARVGDDGAQDEEQELPLGVERVL